LSHGCVAPTDPSMSDSGAICDIIDNTTRLHDLTFAFTGHGPIAQDHLN